MRSLLLMEILMNTPSSLRNQPRPSIGEKISSSRPLSPYSLPPMSSIGQSISPPCHSRKSQASIQGQFSTPLQRTFKIICLGDRLTVISTICTILPSGHWLIKVASVLNKLMQGLKVPLPKISMKYCSLSLESITMKFQKYLRRELL